MTYARLTTFVLIALAAAGCSQSGSDPVSKAVNATMPLPQEAQYTYWKRVPGTNTYEQLTTDHALSADEKAQHGIVDADAK